MRSIGRPRPSALLQCRDVGSGVADMLVDLPAPAQIAVTEVPEIGAELGLVFVERQSTRLSYDGLELRAERAIGGSLPRLLFVRTGWRGKTSAVRKQDETGRPCSDQTMRARRYTR